MRETILRSSGDPVVAPSRLRRRILVADDNADAAATLAMLLELDGHDVLTASNGVEALRLAEAQHPEIVLLDLGMPGMDGYACCRRLRAEAWACSVRIFALTGWARDEDRRLSGEAGFDGHLLKPLDESVLALLLAM